CLPSPGTWAASSPTGTESGSPTRSRRPTGTATPPPRPARAPPGGPDRCSCPPLPGWRADPATAAPLPGRWLARALSLECRLVRGGQAQHGADHRGRGTDLCFERPQPDRHVGLGVVAGEIDVADHEDHPWPDHL